MKSMGVFGCSYVLSLARKEVTGMALDLNSVTESRSTPCRRDRLWFASEESQHGPLIHIGNPIIVASYYDCIFGNATKVHQL
uniref:Uncharacterized protein n=1 Tax=Oryza rufipogon TaxID=4529 RepID=A0A0E0QNU1_ORYRU